MNYEAEILHKILDDSTDQTLRRVLSTNFDFTAYNKNVIIFITDFYTKYESLPSIDVVKDEFKKVVLFEPKNPVDFLIDKLTIITKQRYIEEMQDQLANANSAGDINEATRIASVLSAGLKSIVSTKSSDESLLSKEFRDHIFQEYREKREAGDEVFGVRSGFTHLDKDIGGFQGGDFIVLVARPGSFKSWIIIQSATHMVRAGHKVLFFSKEMNKQQIRMRFNSLLLGYQSHDNVRFYKLEDKDLKALEKEWEDLESKGGELILIGKEVGLNYDMGYVHAKVIEYEPDIVLVDGAYLLGKSREWRDQAPISTGLKDIAFSEDIPIMITHQFAKGFKESGKKKKSTVFTLDDLGFSDAFAQDGGIIIGMGRRWDGATNKATNTLVMQPLKIREAEGQTSFIIEAEFKDGAYLHEKSFVMSEEVDGTDWTMEDVAQDLKKSGFTRPTVDDSVYDED